MKEVMCIIRINKMNDTKRALSEAGFPSVTCRKVQGRGKKKAEYTLIQELIEDVNAGSKETIEALSESHRLIAKRLLSIVVQDEEVDNIVRIIIEHNQTGNMGDGKLFVMPIAETIRIRTGESGSAAV